MKSASEEIIINFPNNDDVTEPGKCVVEPNSTSRLSVFVTNAAVATLKGSSISQECMWRGCWPQLLEDLQDALGFRIHRCRYALSVTFHIAQDHSKKTLCNESKKKGKER